MPVIARVRPIHIGLLYSLEVCPTKKLRKSSWHGLLLPHSQCEAHTHTLYITLQSMLNGIVLLDALGTWDIPFRRELGDTCESLLVTCRRHWFVIFGDSLVIGDIRLAENNHRLLLWNVMSPQVAHDCDLALLEAPSTVHGLTYPYCTLWRETGFLCFLFSLLPFIHKWSGPTVSYHYISFITYPFWLTYVFNVYIWCEAVWRKHAITSIHACELH